MASSSVTQVDPSASLSPAADWLRLPGEQLPLRMLHRQLSRWVSTIPFPCENKHPLTLLDPAEECTGYNYQPASSLTSGLPSIWEIATLVDADSEATQLFSEVNSTLNSKFSYISPRGTTSGDFSNVNYPSNDPACWWTNGKCTTPAANTSLPADLTTVPEPKTWGFGFDDGPNCSHNALYDFLQEQQQQATMFFIGSNVIDWPLQALRAIDDGHEICVHTWSHRYMTSLSNEQAFAELYYTRKVIKELLGVTPRCWRPPFGDVDDRIRYIATSLDLTNIIWEHDTDDWAAGTSGITTADIDKNYQDIIDGVAAGQYDTHGPIVLNHELNNYTMTEMMNYYPKIKAAFSAIVPIQAAYNITQPFAEANYTYPDFSAYVGGNHNKSIGTDTAYRTDAYTHTEGQVAAATGTDAAAASGASGSSGASGASASGASASGSSSSDGKSSAFAQMEVGLGVSALAAVAGAAAIFF